MEKHYCDCCGKELHGNGNKITVRYVGIVKMETKHNTKEFCYGCYFNVKKHVLYALNMKKSVGSEK
ncbi:MAG: hypothetical protein ACOC80_16520 [Petrotogales bacterium]